MWDIVVNTLNSLGLKGLSNFLYFVQHREQLISQLTDGKKTLVNVGKFQYDMFITYRKDMDPILKEMISFAPEYLAYTIPESAIEQVEDFFINLGRTLEMKRELRRDKILQKVATIAKAGEMYKISRL